MSFKKLKAAANTEIPQPEKSAALGFSPKSITSNPKLSVEVMNPEISGNFAARTIC